MTKLLIGREYPDEVINSVKNAKNSIRIFMYDWRWYGKHPASKIQTLNREIINASKRGVDVKAILNNKFILGLLSKYGIKAIVINASRTMHAKIVIVDEKEIFIGSHNFSVNGFEINHEFSLKLYDKDIINRCIKYFNNLCHS